MRLPTGAAIDTDLVAGQGCLDADGGTASGVQDDGVRARRAVADGLAGAVSRPIRRTRLPPPTMRRTGRRKRSLSSFSSHAAHRPVRAQRRENRPMPTPRSRWPGIPPTVSRRDGRRSDTTDPSHCTSLTPHAAWGATPVALTATTAASAIPARSGRRAHHNDDTAAAASAANTTNRTQTTTPADQTERNQALSP